MRSPLLALIAVAVLVYPTDASEPRPAKPRVLLIGDSLTSTDYPPAMVEVMAVHCGAANGIVE